MDQTAFWVLINIFNLSYGTLFWTNPISSPRKFTVFFHIFFYSSWVRNCFLSCINVEVIVTKPLLVNYSVKWNSLVLFTYMLSCWIHPQRYQFISAVYSYSVWIKYSSKKNISLFVITLSSNLVMWHIHTLGIKWLDFVSDW